MKGQTHLARQVPKWVWPSMNRYRMFFIQTSTLPPGMHQKLTKHGRFCRQNNQLPTKTHVELKDNSIKLQMILCPVHEFMKHCDKFLKPWCSWMSSRLNLAFRDLSVLGYCGNVSEAPGIGIPIVWISRTQNKRSKLEGHESSREGEGRREFPVEHWIT
jgi:hypothetical protein